MKAIINGKRYDTDTAREISSNGNDASYSDFRHWHEVRYRTKKGAWFVHGEGGPMSRWARSVNNGSTGGEGIIPLTDGEARDWLEKAKDTRSLELYFPVEDA